MVCGFVVRGFVSSWFDWGLGLGLVPSLRLCIDLEAGVSDGHVVEIHTARFDEVDKLELKSLTVEKTS